MDDRRLLNEASLQRHDLMNHLQVIGGWLQMGRPERALAYVQSLCGKLEKDRAWQTMLPAGLAGRVLRWQRSLRLEESVAIDVELAVDGAEPAEWECLAGRIDPLLTELGAAALKECEHGSVERFTLLLAPGGLRLQADGRQVWPGVAGDGADASL